MGKYCASVPNGRMSKPPAPPEVTPPVAPLPEALPEPEPRKRGIGRNPRTGKEVRIPPGRTIRFKPGKELQNIG